MSLSPEARVPQVAVRKDYSDVFGKGETDRARHKEKVKDAIKRNMRDLIASQDIITAPEGKQFKIRLKRNEFLENPQFIFDRKKQKGIGSGGGKPGDIIGREPGQQGPGSGPGAGDQPGIDYIEADVTLEELAAMAFEDLGLPYLENKRKKDLESEDIQFTDIRKTGPFSNLDKKRMMKENIKRNAARGDPHLKNPSMDDLRFRTWDVAVRQENNAVIYAMMDTSGSMGTREKFVARTFYWWMTRFLRTRYNNVDIVFIAHHTEAKEVPENEFFNKGESGGTKCSSAYKLALDITDDRYNPNDWNIYPFHFSDGDNWPEDNKQCLEYAQQLVDRSNQLGYGEIRTSQYSSESTLMKTFDQIKDPRFTKAVLKDEKDTFPVLKQFFKKEGVEGGVSRS